MLALALAMWTLLACERDDGDHCTDPVSPEVAGLCTVDRAAELAHGGQPDQSLALCEAMAEGRWRGECHFQVAEALSLAGELVRALEVCREASDFDQMCFGHVLWLRSDQLVDRTPADADAADAIEAFVGTLPTGGLAAAGLADVGRAAAWQGIYGGSGSTDPTAARAATGVHAPHARGAFAWELVRLLGPDRPTQELVDAAWATWQGERPPVTGATQPVRCWSIRLVPRADLLSPLYEGSVRTYGGDVRFVDADPQIDLLVATLGAIYAHGGRPDPELLRALVDHDSAAVQKTVARLVGADEASFPEPNTVFSEPDLQRKLARVTRRAALLGQSPRPYTPPGAEACP